VSVKTLHQRCAGLDVHKQEVVACLRLATKGRVHREVRRFPTTTRGLLELADWLEAARCTIVAMEATGVFWKPVWHVLDEHVWPDGMLLVNPAHGINATLYKNLSFNFIRDVAPVAGLVRTPNVMEVTPSFPAKTVAEFIAYCKANPGKINMASSGSGTSVHLSGELFKSMTGCQMLHVPYKGAGPALTDLMGGQVDVIFDNLPSSMGHIKGGKIRALGVTSQEREPSMPQLPTIAETVPGYEATAWFGIGMPKGTPKEIIDKVNAEVNRALADPKMRERLAELGGKPIAGTPEDFGKVIAAETAKWEKVVISSGAKVE